ncbi:16S rRNA (guanine966-N2)-methyltransferase [Solimonas aquatica]|uniref:Ribosomal RNA small subunit methyltransferase D n=1 Tax=Solimonas aquatica TaxID=489703 RepID=A0A1H9M7L9_9GAMM|nr:16S rRNA (guanine(966)-N(2))-methyltransferase RsmD [Solimonas aquatica]SER19475.1 16S rRNA (guanine966-N2)-methyltransferase [Solimonas aquatica]
MASRGEGKLRVIGGQWRSRLVEFDPASGVRPTPDRVRQTLFDWLAPRIEGARCLDLFAGSGALGIEALSRGAGSCCFVEEGHRQANAIRNALLLLHAQHAEVVELDAIYYLDQTWHRYDLVFLDPPYGKGLLERALAELPRALKPQGSHVYLEWPEGKQPELPAGYSLVREKQAGQVCFALATYQHPGKS